MTVKKSLVEKIVEASQQIKAIGKDGKNSYQGYTFQSESAIKSAVKAALDNVGLTIIPMFQVLDQRDVTNNRGKTAHIVDVLGSFYITDGTEHLVGRMPGSGLDNGEKATAKACTSAQKYFYKQLFNISDKDEDPDATDSNLAQTNGNYPQSHYRSRQQPARQAQQPVPKQQANSKASSEFEGLVNKIAVNSSSPVAKVKEAIGKTLNANKEYQNMSSVDKQKKAISVAKNMLGEK